MKPPIPATAITSRSNGLPRTKNKPTVHNSLIITNIYQRNQIAGSLRGQATDLVAVVMPSMSNHFFPNIFDGIDDALKGSQLRLGLGMTEYEEASEEAILRDMFTWNPAAVILSDSEHSDGAKEMLAHLSGPIVEIMDCDGHAIYPRWNDLIM